MFDIFKKKKDNNLYAPVTGKMIPLDSVPDKMFADKLLGDGVGFKFTDKIVCAPCDGEITMIAPTSHAVGITASNGAEILIHIGLDTVTLNGQGFKQLKKAGDKVKKGTPLIEIDHEFMNKNNINLITPMVITNGDEFSFDINTENQNVNSKESIVISFK